MPRDEMHRIADQLERAVNGPAWHGQAMLELLRGVSAKTAAAKPLPKAHSIWELVVHTRAWLDLVRQRLEGTAPLRITEEMNWPPVNRPGGPATTAGSADRRWRAEVSELRRAAKDLRQAIDKQDDQRLTDELPGVDDTWSAYHSLHGVLQHTLYHAGQIAILKKGNP